MWQLIFFIIIVALMVGAPILITSSSKDKKMKDNALQNYIDFINKMRKELLSFSKGDK